MRIRWIASRDCILNLNDILKFTFLCVLYRENIIEINHSVPLENITDKGQVYQYIIDVKVPKRKHLGTYNFL